MNQYKPFDEMNPTVLTSTSNPGLTEEQTVGRNETESPGSSIFRYVSYIGWGLSILSLVITVATYLALRTLRTRTPSRLLICLSLSLLCLYIVFATGVKNTGNDVVCHVVAALLHYFTLTTVAWMSVESYAVYLWVVKLKKSQGVRFFVMSCLIGWGLPLVIVGCIAIISNGHQYDSEKTEKICYMATPKTSERTSWAFICFNLALIFLVMFCNFLFLFFVTKELVFGRNFAPRYGDRDHDKQRRQAIIRTVNDLVVSILLVVTWIFATVVHYYPDVPEQNNTSYAFVMLFCLCYFLQGFMVFLLFCVRLEEVRQVWKLWFFKLYEWIKYVREPLYMLLFIAIMYFVLEVVRIGSPRPGTDAR